MDFLNKEGLTHFYNGLVQRFFKRHFANTSDLNEVFKEGIHNYHAETGNRPDGATSGRFIVTNRAVDGSKVCTQMLIDDGGNLYTRHSSEDGGKVTWSAWQTLAFLSNPQFSGIPLAPNAAADADNTQVATTAWVRSLIKTMGQEGGLGGIVAGNLELNGWVKFSNGLIIQWGRVMTATHKTVSNLPINFTQKALIALACDVGAGAYRVGASVQTLNTVTIFQASTEAPLTGIAYWYFTLGV